jgi:hypothetical protein
MNSNSNLAFVSTSSESVEASHDEVIEKSENLREGWGKDIEFLFSCIALSVGLDTKKRKLNFTYLY